MEESEDTLSGRVNDEENVEEGEYTEDFPLDEGRDDELEQILQQTVPLDQADQGTNIKPEKPRTSINFTSLPNAEESKSKKREREPKISTEKPAAAKLKVLPLDALLKRDRPVRYFIMKCVDTKNLAIALSKNIWSTQSHNEKKLREAYQVIDSADNNLNSNHLIFFRTMR